MRRCPICQNTFDDSKRFCQVDGTLLVDEAQSGTPLPSDPLKTQFGGAGINDSAQDVSPFGDDATKALNHETGQMPFDPSASSPSAPFGDSPSAFGSSPFSNESTPSASTPFGVPNYQSPSPPFAEPQQQPFNSSPFDAAQSSYGQPLAQSAWTPPPAPDAGWQSQNIGANTPFAPPMVGASGDNKTLAIVSLVCGILSLTCCGAVTGIAALITGFMAKNNVDANPQQYGGRGLAIAGMIMGAISIVLTVLWLVFAGIGSVLR